MIIQAMKKVLDYIENDDRLPSELSHILLQAIAEAEKQVSYSGNGTAGRENMTAPTGFLFQMPKQEYCGDANPPTNHGTYAQGVMAERQRIVNLLMIQHEAANGTHNYWQVAANLIQAEAVSVTTPPQPKREPLKYTVTAKCCKCGNAETYDLTIGEAAHGIKEENDETSPRTTGAT